MLFVISMLDCLFLICMQSNCVHLVKNCALQGGFLKGAAVVFWKTALDDLPSKLLANSCKHLADVPKGLHHEMLSAFSEWIDTATPLIPAGTLRPKLCHSPISYPLTQCTMMCNSSFKPAPFPLSANPWLTRLMNAVPWMLDERARKFILGRDVRGDIAFTTTEPGDVPSDSAAKSHFTTRSTSVTACNPPCSKQSIPAGHGLLPGGHWQEHSSREHCFSCQGLNSD